MKFNWDAIAASVGQLVTVGAPIIEALDPAAAPAVEIGSQILKGLAASEPQAKALVQQIQSGQPVTAQQLAQYYDQYKADDDALNADIAEHIAAAQQG